MTAKVMPMQINPHGIELIKRFEGFRGTAYLCPAGYWTIGYGHTSMAGPPEVKRGMKMTRAEAAKVLARDVEGFADGVRGFLRRDLSENQFSALVSFAFNVGLGALRSSSVLKAVNKGDFEAVPRRLNLWIKGGGRILPGLQKRRAAEGNLFMMPDGLGLMAAALPQVAPIEIEAMDEARGLVEQLVGKDAAQSTTVWGAVIGGLAGAFGFVKDALYEFQDIAYYLPLPPKWMAIGIGLVIVGAATYWIISERIAKSRDDAL